MKLLLLFLFIAVSLITYGQDDWQDGHYIDKKDNIYFGQIKYEYDYKASFKFRNSEGEKELKIKALNIKAFIVEKDSFIVIRDFELLRGQPVSYGFAQVLEVGSIILLKNFCRITYGGSPMPGGYGMSQGSSTKVETFILTKQDSEKLWIVYSKKKKFNALLEDIVKDFPSDSPYKDVNTIKYEMMPEIIAEYNRLKENKDI